MGISMSGLMVKSDVNKTPELMENLFQRKIIRQDVVKWDYYSQFDGVNTNQIAVFSNEKASSLYFGDLFDRLATYMFVDRTVKGISTDYLYYAFNETAMAFVFSYRKTGTLQEDYYGMEGDDFIHSGSNFLGLSIEDNDIAQDGLALALSEFGLDINENETVTIYTFDSKPVVKRSSKDLETLETKVKESDLKFLIHDYSVALLDHITNQHPTTDRINQLASKLKVNGIRVTELNFSTDDFKFEVKKYRRATTEKVQAEKKKLIDQIVQGDGFASVVPRLVYVQGIIRSRINGTKLFPSGWDVVKSVGGIALTILGIITSVILLVYKLSG